MTTAPPGRPANAASGDGETGPFWEALSDGRLILKRCVGCRNVGWYPRFVCGVCAGTTWEWVEASGRGTIYSHTIVRHQGHPLIEGSGAYCLAYVELVEGPRVLANVVVDDFDVVRIGRAVRMVFGTGGSDVRVLRFAPI